MSAKSTNTWVGWQGIVAEVPADWSLAAASGDEKSGYFRVDSTGSLALEVKWSKVGKQVDLYAQLGNYLDDLRRKARKKKLNFDQKIKSKEGGAVSFTWRADRKAQGKLWVCEDCGRVIIAQVSGEPSDDVSNIASWVLPTIEDHSEDGWRTWALYELIAESPPGYRLEKQRLLSGYIQLTFRKGVNRLVIERWGLANVALRNADLKDWYEDRAAVDLRAFNYSVDPVDFEGEPGLAVKGRMSVPALAIRGLRELLTFRKPAIHLTAYAWVCESTNKVFSVRMMHTAAESIADEVLERVECH